MQDLDLITRHVDGKFPMDLYLVKRNIPPHLKEGSIADILVENDPVYVSGQRSAIYDLGQGIYLKAKGFVYRPICLEEVQTFEISNKQLLTQEFCRSRNLSMGLVQRPNPSRFLETTGNFYRHIPQPDGSFKKELSQARPHGAMTYSRAYTEFDWLQRFREMDFCVDIPLGLASFPSFGFRHRGKEILCGGVLSLIPTPYDLRIPEILFHTSALSSLYGSQLDPRTFFLGCCEEAAHTLQAFHRVNTTLTFPHWMNYKIGFLKDDFTPIFFDDDNKPLICIGDLDGVEYSQNKNNIVFFANLINDLGSLFDFPAEFMYRKPIDLNKKKLLKVGDDIKRYLTLVNMLKSTFSGGHFVAQCLLSYFNLPSFDYRLQYPQMFSFERMVHSGKNIADFDEDLVAYLLREKYNLGTRRYTYKPKGREERVVG